MRDRLKRWLFEGEVLRLMGLSVMSKPLGMMTQMLLARQFGAGVQYDAYLLAWFLVTFVQRTLGSVYSSVVIPFMIREREGLSHDRRHGLQIATYLLFIVPALVYAMILVVRGDLLLLLVAHNAPTETRTLATSMLKLMAFPGTLLAVVAMGNATLNLNRRFRVPATTPAIQSLALLVGIIVLHRPLGIWAVPVAFSCGVLVQFLVVAGYLLASRTVALVRPYLPKGAVAKLGAMGGLILVATTFQTINAFLDKMFAAGLAPGSISSIAYSTTLVNLGVQAFSMSLVTVMFTRMSELMVAGDYRQLDGYVQYNIHRMVRLLVPAALGVMVASHEVVRVLFQRGAFTDQDTARTAAALTMYMCGLPALIVNAAVARIFHSLQKMRDKAWLAFQYLATNLVGNLLLVGPLKVTGLALSSTIAINTHLFLSLLVLGRYGLELRVGRYSLTIVRAYITAFLAWAIYMMLGTSRWIGQLVENEGIASVIMSGFTKAAAIVILFGIIWYMGSPRRRYG